MLIPIKQILTEATRWKEESQNLSKNSLKRIEKSGIRKPDSLLADGIWDGTKNILKKHLPETEIKYSKLSGKVNHDSGGAYFDPGSKEKNINPSINVDKDPSFMRRLFSENERVFQNKGVGLLNKALDGRHEAYEAKYHNYKNPESKGNFYTKNNSLKNKLLKKNEYYHIGNHNTAKVLSDEARDINKLQYTQSGKTYKKMRTDENNILKNKIGIDLNNITNKNISKINKTIDNFERKNNAYY